LRIFIVQAKLVPNYMQPERRRPFVLLPCNNMRGEASGSAEMEFILAEGACFRPARGRNWILTPSLLEFDQFCHRAALQTVN
jgi:hypothetical protein